MDFFVSSLIWFSCSSLSRGDTCRFVSMICWERRTDAKHDTQREASSQEDIQWQSYLRCRRCQLVHQCLTRTAQFLCYLYANGIHTVCCFIVFAWILHVSSNAFWQQPQKINHGFILDMFNGFGKQSVFLKKDHCQKCQLKKKIVVTNNHRISPWVAHIWNQITTLSYCQNFVLLIVGDSKRTKFHFTSSHFCSSRNKISDNLCRLLLAPILSKTKSL